MRDPQLVPLPPDIAALVEAKRAPRLASFDAKQRVWSRVHSTLGILSDPGGGGDGTAGGGDGAISSTRELAQGALRSSLGVWTKPLPLALTTFLAGAGVGAGIHAKLGNTPERAVPERIALSNARSMSSAPAMETPTRGADSDHAAAPPPVKPLRSRSAGSDRALAAERALLERARSALMRGDANLALEALAQHRNRFPSARLAEERESLWVQSLAGSGRIIEAKHKAEEFRARFPQSIFLEVVNRSVGSSP